MCNINELLLHLGFITMYVLAFSESNIKDTMTGLRFTNKKVMSFLKSTIKDEMVDKGNNI